ncbi:DUF2076 family protein [Microbacterium sp. 22303]|uniref:DUF2076 family protein n=1 Tax=Microbacterium sp. 22303 TaxID=3453905 RepID=UPI003F8529E8
MQTSDARLIIDLADSVRNAAPIQKDAEAAQLISQLIGSQPDALYFLVQTVLLQKEALAAQQTGSGPAAGASYAAPAAASAPAPPQAEEQRGRWGGLFGARRPSGPAEAGSSGGSFLKTAAAGAAGVAGGVLLAQGISGLMSAPHDQHHAEADHDDSDWDDDGWDSF